MIDPKELRIGNFVKYTGKPYEYYPLKDGIVEIEEVLRDGVDRSQGDQTLYESKDLEPIPIDAEWLERFGFEDIDFINTDGIEETYYRLPEVGFQFKDNLMLLGNTLEYIQYVHQLQNLYFAITGKDLLIK